MLKSIISRIKQQNYEFNKQYTNAKIQQSKSVQSFRAEYKQSQHNINEVRNRINSTRSK